MHQDNNIVKICVVNEAEDILVEVIITTRLVNFWLQVHALRAMQADIGPYNYGGRIDCKKRKR